MDRRLARRLRQLPPLLSPTNAQAVRATAILTGDRLNDEQLADRELELERTLRSATAILTASVADAAWGPDLRRAWRSGIRASEREMATLRRRRFWQPWLRQLVVVIGALSGVAVFIGAVSGLVTWYVEESGAPVVRGATLDWPTATGVGITVSSVVLVAGYLASQAGRSLLAYPTHRAPRMFLALVISGVLFLTFDLALRLHHTSVIDLYDQWRSSNTSAATVIGTTVLSALGIAMLTYSARATLDRSAPGSSRLMSAAGACLLAAYVLLVAMVAIVQLTAWGWLGSAMISFASVLVIAGLVFGVASPIRYLSERMAMWRELTAIGVVVSRAGFRQWEWPALAAAMILQWLWLWLVSGAAASLPIDAQPVSVAVTTLLMLTGSTLLGIGICALIIISLVFALNVNHHFDAVENSRSTETVAQPGSSRRPLQT